MDNKILTISSDCSGVGALNQALMRLNVPYKEAFSCDFDYYARLTYLQNYGTPDDVILGNTKEHKFFANQVKKIALKEGELTDKEKQILLDANDFAKRFSFYYPFDMQTREVPKDPSDLYVATVPCQSFSISGKRLGEDDKRGILFYDAHRFIQNNGPKYFIFENVKGLLSADKGDIFRNWIRLLGGVSINGEDVLNPDPDSVPYHIHHKVLNAKFYDVAQNRERIFIVGIRHDLTNDFKFQEPNTEVTKIINDILEDNVDEKYFYSQDVTDKIIFDDHYSPDKEARTQRCGIGATLTKKHAYNIVRIGNMNPSGKGMNGNVYSTEGISPTVTTNKGEGNKIYRINSAVKRGYKEAGPGDSINFTFPSSKTRHGRVGKQVPQTFDTACNQGIISNDRLRRFTPREVFRLMDFPDTFTWPVSDSQAYRQAGNSVVIKMFEIIIKKLLNIPNVVQDK